MPQTPADQLSAAAQRLTDLADAAQNNLVAVFTPATAHAIARWLESVTVRHIPRRESSGLSGGYTTGCAGCGGDDWPCADLTPALAVARQILDAPAAEKSGDTPLLTEGIPLGHSVPSHRVHGWCSHCPGRSLAEEVAAWQVNALDRTVITAPSGDDRDAENERLRTENERMRHELEVMYGGAFDSLPAPADEAEAEKEFDGPFLTAEEERRLEVKWAAAQAEGPTPQCSAGLLPATDAAVDRCIRRGPHDTHKTASGALWPATEEPSL